MSVMDAGMAAAPSQGTVQVVTLGAKPLENGTAEKGAAGEAAKDVKVEERTADEASAKTSPSRVPLAAPSPAL